MSRRVVVRMNRWPRTKIARTLASEVLTATIGWKPTGPGRKWLDEDIEAIAELIDSRLAPVPRALDAIAIMELASKPGNEEEDIAAIHKTIRMFEEPSDGPHQG